MALTIAATRARENRPSRRILHRALVGCATAWLFVSACYDDYGGKAEAARASQERRVRELEVAKGNGCVCVSGTRCDSPESGYPAVDALAGGNGARCCISSNCEDGLACDPSTTPTVCAPMDGVIERETLASCAAGAPKIWEQTSPVSCGQDSHGYEALRWAVGPNAERIRYLSAADRTSLRSIQRGVFLVVSRAGSRAGRQSPLPPSIAMLQDVLGRVGPSVEVVVAEKRCLDKELVALLNLRCDDRGDGEVAWIHDGEIIATTGYGFHPEKIGPNTDRLLALP